MDINFKDKKFEDEFFSILEKNNQSNSQDSMDSMDSISTEDFNKMFTVEEKVDILKILKIINNNVKLTADSINTFFENRSSMESKLNILNERLNSNKKARNSINETFKKNKNNELKENIEETTNILNELFDSENFSDISKSGKINDGRFESFVNNKNIDNNNKAAQLAALQIALQNDDYTLLEDVLEQMRITDDAFALPDSGSVLGKRKSTGGSRRKKDKVSKGGKKSKKQQKKSNKGGKNSKRKYK